MEFEPGQVYSLKGREDIGMHYRVWGENAPLQALYIRDENIDGSDWYVFATTTKIGSGADSATLMRVRIPKDKARAVTDNMYVGDHIVTKIIVSRRTDDIRTATINDFVDEALKLLENNANPEVGELKEVLRRDRLN